jgi:hypothetical protein
MALVIFVSACIPAWLSIAQNATTPFDEIAHYDYVDKIAHLEIPKKDEQYGQRTLEMVACSYPDPLNIWSGIGTCGDKVLNADNAPFKGQNYVASYSPVYYSLVALIYGSFKVINRLCDLNVQSIHLMRIANSLLSGLAALVIYFALLLFGTRKRFAIPIALSFIAAPAIVLQFATVNSDAGAHLAVALIFFISAKIRSENLRDDSSPFEPGRIRKTLFYLCVIALLCTVKETVLLTLPLSMVLIFPRRPTSSRLTSSWFIRIATGVIITGFTGFFRIVQPLTRGVGGNDELFAWQKQTAPPNFETISNAPNIAIDAFRQITWPQLNDHISVFNSGLLLLLVSAGIATALIDSQRNDLLGISKHDEVSSGYLMNLLAVPIGSALLALLSALLYGVAFTQPRYFLAAMELLVVMSGLLASRSNRNSVAVIWTVPIALTIFSVLI